MSRCLGEAIVRTTMLYLHCGWPRTGTTSFQYALGTSRAELLEAGIAYPSEWETDGSLGHHGLVPLLVPGDDQQQGLEELDAKLEAYEGSVLLSTEGVTNRVRPGLPGLSRFLETVGHGRDLTCLWTLRRIDEFYASMHLHQALINGAFRSPKDFFLKRYHNRWIEIFARGAAELERATARALYTRYDAAGKHHEELLEGAGVPEPVRSQIVDRIRTAGRRGATVTHKTAVVINHRKLFSERAGLEITENGLYRLLRDGRLRFENDAKIDLVGGELRSLVHQQALDVCRECGFEPYPRFFEADEIEASPPRSLDPDVITEDDIHGLVTALEEARTDGVPRRLSTRS
jgi:hypothetical protein